VRDTSSEKPDTDKPLSKYVGKTIAEKFQNSKFGKIIEDEDENEIHILESNTNSTIKVEEIIDSKYSS
jgi:hypothetical protein